MRLVALGPPGAGKGTQTVALARHFGIAHISTGDMLREQMRLRTRLGIEIEGLMNNGSLVSDDIVIDLVSKKLEELGDKGFIFDGFPRTLVQAKKLDEMLEKANHPLDRVLYITAADETIMERMAGRRICPHCQRVYHLVYNPPGSDGCGQCLDSLVQRDDDKPETVSQRLKIYHELTTPIIDYYRNDGRLLWVDGIGDITRITSQIVSKLEEV